MKTSEYVTPSHPDKVCDRISDAILDACLAQDPESRVAIEVVGSHGIITVAGELTTKAYIDIPEIVKKIVGDKFGIQVNIKNQSQEIAVGVDTGGAGDQGIVCGYACNENEDMIPKEHYLARSLCKFIYQKFPVDGKTQVTLNDEDELDSVVASFCGVSSTQLEALIGEWAMIHKIEEQFTTFCNPAGEWSTGGFDADTGLTGRKIVMDSYGPQISVGGGAFSGKDATKIDRSGAYIARKLAVKLLKADSSLTEVFVKLAYVIGMPYPVMATAKGVNTMKTRIDLVIPAQDLTPTGIITTLNLKEPQFEKTAAWGHFGNNFEWDNGDE